jgi:hypothetical protein
MTKDDAIRMAHEAGFLESVTRMWPEYFEAFAAIVAAHKAEVITAEAYRCGYEAGAVAEREQCAKSCDAIHAKHIQTFGDYLGDTYAVECATTIRARSNHD